MTQTEYDIIDELYLVAPWQELFENVGINEQELIKNLAILLQKGWVQFLAFDEESKDLRKQEPEFFNTEKAKEYHYLATKKGLLAHVNEEIEE